MLKIRGTHYNCKSLWSPYLLAESSMIWLTLQPTFTLRMSNRILSVFSNVCINLNWRAVFYFDADNLGWSISFKWSRHLAALSHFIFFCNIYFVLFQFFFHFICHTVQRCKYFYQLNLINYVLFVSICRYSDLLTTIHKTCYFQRPDAKTVNLGNKQFTSNSNTSYYW